jgi:mono/diheme cytochrome c family protein
MRGVLALTCAVWATACVGGHRIDGLARAPEPMSADSNPAGSDTRAGEKLYARHCAECHGGDGRGRTGPSLRTARVRGASPGQLFWMLTNGDLRGGMPSWSHLPAARRWQIVAYVSALEADPAITPPERRSTAAALPVSPRPR